MRWSVDHLLLDQNGRPTLVEVKRSSDTRIRREVVGQMLDYVANTQVYWPVDKIRTLAAEQFGGPEVADHAILELLGVDPPSDQEFPETVENYWKQVEVNLRQGVLRLLFVMAMSAIYDKKMPTLREYADRFRPVDMQVGALFTINRRIAGLDGFAGPGALSTYFKKLVESYALDAIDRFEPQKEHKARKGDVTAFLKNSLSARVESRPSVALGTDCRISSAGLNGFALVLEGQVLHLAMFAGNGRGNGPGRGSRMQRPSARRRRNRF